MYPPLNRSHLDDMFRFPYQLNPNKLSSSGIMQAVLESLEPKQPRYLLELITIYVRLQLVLQK